MSLEHTRGQIATPDGARSVPATIFSADAAAIFRDAFYWYLSHALEPELLCASCFEHTRESKAEYLIDDHEIRILCACAIRYFTGPWLKPVITPSFTKPVDASGPLLMTLSSDAARLLRHYKNVLLQIGLKQALRCNACYELGQEDGCEAQTTDSSILIRCRCTRRVYQGMSV